MTDIFKKTIKILIVDDNADMRQLLRITFNADKYELLEAENGQIAIDIILKETPDIILLDIMMPGEIDGLGVCQYVRKSKLKYSWIILLTAKGQHEDFQKGLDAGADFYVTKPFSPLALIDLVENISKK